MSFPGICKSCNKNPCYENEEYCADCRHLSKKDLIISFIRRKSNCKLKDDC